jgi:hypothetical protein
MGRYLFRGLALRKFTLDPIGSFTIDQKVAEPLHDLLRVGLYQGALILVEDSTAGASSDLLGRRFRISYRLAPTLYLPLRLYKSINLSRCLSTTPDMNDNVDQVELLDGEPQ